MKNFFQKQREILAIFFYVLFILALVWVVILPLLGKINNVNDQIQQEAMKQQSNKQRLDDLPKIQAQAEAVEKNQAALDVLLDKNNAVVLIEKLEKLADDSGDKITIAVQDQASAKTLAPAETPAPAGAASTPPDNSLVSKLPNQNYLQLKITLDGNLNSIAAFIKSLESFEYYSDIIGLDIKKSDPTAAGAAALAGSGMLSPFDAAGKPIAAPASPTAATVPTDSLSASLDVVFYTK